MFQHSTLCLVIFSTTAVATLTGCDSTQLDAGFAGNDPSVRLESLLASSEDCQSIEIDISGTSLPGHSGKINTSPDVALDSPVPKGEYRIRLHYEDESHPDQADQPNEQWYAELFDQYGNIVLMTPETADLPSDEIISYTDVGSHDLTEDVYKIRAVHAYPTEEYNSIYPTMVEFYPNCVTTDQIPPVISLIGEQTLTLYQNQTYIELGATAIDNVDGDISSSIVISGDTVDTSVFGSYTITYNVQDAAGNIATQVSRIVEVTLSEEGIELTNSL